MALSRRSSFASRRLRFGLGRGPGLARAVLAVAVAVAVAPLGGCRPDETKPAHTVARVRAAGPFVSRVALDASGMALLGVADRDELRVWSLRTPAAEQVFSPTPAGPVIFAEFVGPERVLTATAAGRFSEWNWGTRALTLEHQMYGQGAAAH